VQLGRGTISAVARTRGLPPAPQDGPIAHIHPEDHPIRRWLVGPPRWVFHGACAVLTLWLFWAASRPGYDITEDDAALPRLLLFGCAVVWLVRLIALLVRRERPGRWWAIAPLAGLTVGAMMFWDAPLHARFALARGELGGVARSVLAAPDPTAAAAQRGDLGRVGSYRVQHIEVADGAVFFLVGHGNAFVGDTGFAYVPPAAQIPEGTPYVRVLHHLGGPWYTWTQHHGH
jgi:hypothetical protein